MRLSDKQKKCIDIAQWIMIGILMITCAIVYIGKRNLSKERDIQKDNTYAKIYDSRSIADLKRENRALYDSLKKKSDMTPDIALEIKYKYRYKTDTIKSKEFVLQKDSIYHYSHNNDTIETNIDIKAKDLSWCKVDATINDKFTIINRRQGNHNQITVTPQSKNVEIQNVTAWHKKTSWKDRFGFGPSVGVGYGVINRKPDVFVGFTVTYHIGKNK